MPRASLPDKSKGSKKQERKCYRKETCLDLRKTYGDQLFPVCPALEKMLAKCPSGQPAFQIQESRFLTLSTVKVVPAFLYLLTQLEPTKETIVVCAHTKPVLYKFIDQTKKLVVALPQLLERDFPCTAQRLEVLGGKFIGAALRYSMNSQTIVYLMPPDDVLKYKQPILFEDWQKKQIAKAGPIDMMQEAIEVRPDMTQELMEMGQMQGEMEMRQLTYTYPVEVIKIASRIANELQVPLAVLSQGKPAKTTKPAEDQATGSSKADIEQQPAKPAQKPDGEQPLRITNALEQMDEKGHITLSRTAIKQAIKDGKIKDFREKDSGPHLVLPSEIMIISAQYGKKS